MALIPTVVSGVEDVLGLLRIFGNIDSVAVFNSSFQQVFINARPLRDAVREPSRIFQHPLENGQLTSDYSIILPVEIEFPMVVAAAFYRNTYNEIRNLFLTKEVLTVQTRANNYPNMIIAEMPHEETPEKFDALSITLKFIQAQIVQSTNLFAPNNPTQVNTQAIGEQTPAVVPPPSPATQQQIKATFSSGALPIGGGGIF